MGTSERRRVSGTRAMQPAKNVGRTGKETEQRQKQIAKDRRGQSPRLSRPEQRAGQASPRSRLGEAAAGAGTALLVGLGHRA